MSEVTTEKGTKLPHMLSSDEIKKGQDVIKKTFTGVFNDIHFNAVQCMMHAEKHGDTSLMTRLLMDCQLKENGFRLQGLIMWMREFSPMELHKNVIKLDGMKDGLKRPWRIAEAHATPFAKSKRFDTEVVPIFRDTLLSPLRKSIKDFKAAIENTKDDGEPVNPSKPHYSGVHRDKVEKFYAELENMLMGVGSFADNSRDFYLAQKAMAEAKMKLEQSAQIN